MNKEELEIEISQIISNFSNFEPSEIYYYTNSGKIQR